MDATGAKDFLISKVVQEAELSHQHLSEIERKMLYFTEAHPSLPDIMEVNAEFERDYDSDDYEDKIVRLLRGARARDLEQSIQFKDMWNDAISALKREDHYLLVMVYRAFPEYRKAIMPTHHTRDYLIYIAIGMALVCLCIGNAEWSR
jgi:hypothetical protein